MPDFSLFNCDFTYDNFRLKTDDVGMIWLKGAALPEKPARREHVGPR